MTKAQPTLSQQVGARIAQKRREKAAREQRDIDQKTMAVAIGVSGAAVSRWERGEGTPRDAALIRLAQYLDTTAAYLRYGDAGESGPPRLGLREPQRPIIPRRARGKEK